MSECYSLSNQKRASGTESKIWLEVGTSLPSKTFSMWITRGKANEIAKSTQSWGKYLIELEWDIIS